MTALRSALLSAFLLAAAAGCTTTSAGEPVPAVRAADTGSSGSWPSRPAELRLDDVDPCALVPQSDLGDYWITKPGKPGEDDKGSPDCFWSASRFGYFGITLRVTEGIEVWRDGSRSGKSADTDPVLDYPAMTIVVPNDDHTCSVAVDVADGQYLLVQAGVDNPPADNHPSVCEYAHRFASMAVAGLVEGS